MSLFDDGLHGGGGDDASHTRGISMTAMVVWLLAIVVVADVVVVAQRFLG